MLVVLILLYVGSQLGSTLIATATADPNQRRMMLLIPLVFVVILYRYPGGAAGLLDHHEPVDDRPAVPDPPPPAAAAEVDRADGVSNGKPKRSWREALAEAASRRAGRASQRGGRRRKQHGAARSPRRAAAAPAAQEEETLGPATMSDADDIRDDVTPTRASSSRSRRWRSCSRRSSTGWASTRRSRSRSGTACSAAALEGEDVGLFIGRHGQTIDAVQHLAQRIVFPDGPSSVRVVIDANGYRERRARGAARRGRRGRRRGGQRPASRSSSTRCRRSSGGSCTSTCASAATSRPTARATSPSAISWSAPLSD